MEYITKDQFIGYLRSALHNLYYPDQLRRNPLTDLFGFAQRFDAASVLQRTLMDSIEKLKPGQEESSQSRSWRMYEALLYRYVRQADRDSVADQLGISGRQFRRELKTAFEVLADNLWKDYQLDSKIDLLEESPVRIEPAFSDPEKPIQDELIWLQGAANNGPTDVKHLVESVLDLARPLANRFNVRINCKQEDDLPDLSIPQLALRHALLTVLNVLIPRAKGKSVNISVDSAGSTLNIKIDGQDLSEQLLTDMNNDQKNLMIVYQIAQMFDGSFSLIDDSDEYFAIFSLPTVEKITVLLIDDNLDSIQLFQRYVSGTRFAICGVHNPDKVIPLAEKLTPRVILLDLMMPGVDGWEVLTQIRQQPLISAIPVVIVSILPQESLALALGANAFLQKPINQKDFIELLNQLTSEK